MASAHRRDTQTEKCTVLTARVREHTVGQQDGGAEGGGGVPSDLSDIEYNPVSRLLHVVVHQDVSRLTVWI